MQVTLPATLSGQMAERQRPRLLEPGELAEAAPPEAVRLPLDLIDPNPLNPREKLPDVDQIADNIKQIGLVEPVAVWRVGERYELISGHRRWAAFLMLAEREPTEVLWKTIPARVLSPSQATAELMLVSAQVHHVRWKPREESTILEKWRRSGMTEKQIGAALSKTESWASRRLRVYADPVLGPFVLKDLLSTTVAEELLTISDPDERRSFAERAQAEGWSQIDTKAAVRQSRLDAQLRHISKRAKELLETLSAIDASKLPTDAAKDLWQLRLRIEFLATGQRPRFPTIEAAQKAAGVRSDAKTRRTRLKVD